MNKTSFISSLILIGFATSCTRETAETEALDVGEVNEVITQPVKEPVLSKEEAERRLTRTLQALTNNTLSLSDDCQNRDKRVRFKDGKAVVGVVECSLNHLEVYLASGEVEYQVDSCKHNNEDIQFSYFVFRTKSNNDLEMISDGEVETPIYICPNN